MHSGSVGTLTEMAQKSAVERILDDGGFSRTTHARNHCEHTEREAHGDLLQIVGCCAGDFDVVGPFAAERRQGDFALAIEILQGVA